MFINVRYGNDELLLCNPHCIVNNLMASVRLRCGLANSGKVLDLSDETGNKLGKSRHKEFTQTLWQTCSACGACAGVS